MEDLSHALLERLLVGLMALDSPTFDHELVVCDQKDDQDDGSAEVRSDAGEIERPEISHETGPPEDEDVEADGQGDDEQPHGQGSQEPDDPLSHRDIMAGQGVAGVDSGRSSSARASEVGVFGRWFPPPLLAAM